MSKVICTLPNASGLINGIKFVTHKQGMISEEISEADAKSLTSISGYHLHDPETGGIAEGQESSAPALTPGADPGKLDPAKGSHFPGTLTPEALASAAIGFTPANRTKLINLLQAQQPAKPPAPATGGKSASAKSSAGTSAPAPAGSTPPASTAASGSTDAPASPPSAQTTGAPGASGTPENPTF